MTDLEELESDELQLDAVTPEQRTERFRELLEELDLRPTELAKRLRALGDYRASAAIMRSFQRMSAGDTAVSAEALVLVRVLVNQQRLRVRAHEQVKWNCQPNGIWNATIECFRVALHPQTKGRWLISLTDEKTGYSPAWQPWVTGLEAAKRKSLTCVADGLLDLCELEAARAARVPTDRTRNSDWFSPSAIP